MKYTVEDLFKKQGDIVCEGCRQIGGLQVFYIDKVKAKASLSCRCKSIQTVDLDLTPKPVPKPEVNKKK